MAHDDEPCAPCPVIRPSCAISRSSCSERLSAEIIRGTIQAAATRAPAPLVSIAFFDRYKGKGVADEAVSFSVRLTFQAPIAR